MTTIQDHVPPSGVRRWGFRVESLGIRLSDHDRLEGWELGHDYVETFWLPAIGPTATVLLRFVGRHVRSSAYEVMDPTHVAVHLGISEQMGRQDPLPATIKRLTHFGLVTIDSAGDDPDMRITVLAGLPPVPDRSQRRWPERLRVLHYRAQARHQITVARRRAS